MSGANGWSAWSSVCVVWIFIVLKGGLLASSISSCASTAMVASSSLGSLVAL